MPRLNLSSAYELVAILRPGRAQFLASHVKPPGREAAALARVTARERSDGGAGDAGARRGTVGSLAWLVAWFVSTARPRFCRSAGARLAISGAQCACIGAGGPPSFMLALAWWRICDLGWAGPALHASDVALEDRCSRWGRGYGCSRATAILADGSLRHRRRTAARAVRWSAGACSCRRWQSPGQAIKSATLKAFITLYDVATMIAQTRFSRGRGRSSSHQSDHMAG